MTTDGLRGTPGIPGSNGLPRTDAVLVVSEDEQHHDATCKRFVEDGPINRPVRVLIDANACAETTNAYADAHEDLCLTEAGITITDILASAAEGDHDASSVHVCVDALPVPTTETESRDLFRFLHALANVVRKHGGGCHVHLCDEVESELPVTVAPIFDQVLELWETGDGTAHRVQNWDAPDRTTP